MTAAILRLGWKLGHRRVLLTVRETLDRSR